MVNIFVMLAYNVYVVGSGYKYIILLKLIKELILLSSKIGDVEL